jgi:uncharacterized protein YdbL (DUF1318 family)
MRKRSHWLTDRPINDINTDGMDDEYSEFSSSDFDNIFEELEKPDYEIRAKDKNINKQSKEAVMKNTRQASYIGELSSGYDAKVQDDYEAGHGDKGQIGKGHTEEVAKSNNWEHDKRDAIGRAASVKLLRRTAAKLTKLADDMENMPEDDIDDLDEEEQFEAEDAAIAGKAAVDEVKDEDEDEGFEDLIEDVKAANDGTKKEAAHPLERDDDTPSSEMSAQTGDEEWVDIGPGEFDDKRDEIGKAADK